MCFDNVRTTPVDDVFTGEMQTEVSIFASTSCVAVCRISADLDGWEACDSSRTRD